MEIFKLISEIVSVVSNILTIIASTIAIYLFFAKKSEISNAFSLLLNWSFQTTLTDLKGKLDRLNEYNANEPTEVLEIKNILHEIAGQIRGNSRLHHSALQLVERLENLASGRRLTEPNKRSIVAEIREFIRNVQINSMNDIEG